MISCEDRIQYEASYEQDLCELRLRGGYNRIEMVKVLKGVVNC